MTNSDFQLKGSTVTVVVLELISHHASSFQEQLLERVQQAPNLFQQSPLLISLERFEGDYLDVDIMIRQCRESGFQPIGFRGGNDNLKALVDRSGFPNIPVTKDKIPARSFEPEPQPQVEPESKTESVEAPQPQIIVETVTEEKLVHKPAKVITRPIRSGQQVYAEASDLIVLSQVSEGAEVLADGNIHVYGALRGRALAGVKGDHSARIFCQSLSAELVSIAGNFLLNDSIEDQWQKQSSQVFLVDEQLKIDAL